MSRHEGYGVPPLRCQLPERLRLCVIADGNTRHGGHHGGKRATIALAEHCAARGDIELLVVCVLSYENIAKRPEAFFLRLEQLFLELGVDIVAEGVFVRAAVRCRIYGALGLLRARGGAAARLAGLLEAITHLTAQVATPRLELVFAVGYPSTLAEEFDLHTVVRTGMEEEGVLRTSGIDVSPSVLCYATSILYPDFGSDHFDAALATARRGFAPTFASGYSVAFIAELLAVVEATDFGPPWRLTLPIAAPVDEVTALLDRLQAEGLADRAAIGVEYAWSASQPPRRYGPPWETARELVLVAPAARAAITRALAPTALIAMGQEGGTFVLPHEPAVWHANVFGAACSAAGVVEAVCRWLRFAEAHPALRGADRVAASVATPPEPVSAPWPPGVASRLRWLDAHPETSIDDLVALAPIDDPREALADAGAAMMLHAARVRGLLPTRPELLRAFLNYQRTATIMCHRVPRETDPAGERWLEVGLHAASLMSAVALSDEEIFDRPTPTLSAEERKAWLSEVAGYLGAVVHGHEAPRPHGPAAAQIDAIAALWRETLDRFQAHAHPAILAGWQGALAALYRSNIDEIDPDVADNPLLLDLSMSGHPRRAAVQAIEARYATRAPAPVAARIRICSLRWLPRPSAFR